MARALPPVRVGFPSPARRREPLLHNASDTELKTRLLALNGTPREILGNDELMELILPVLRADFAILETYEYHEEPPLDVPITVFGATTARRGPRNWRDGAGSQPAHAFICSPAISSSSTEWLPKSCGSSLPTSHRYRCRGTTPAHLTERCSSDRTGDGLLRGSSLEREYRTH